MFKNNIKCSVYLLVAKVFIKMEIIKKLIGGVVIVNGPLCGIAVNEFELQSLYYVHFLTNNLGIGMNPLINPVMC